MAKELPYFQFEPAEYLTKDISFCSLSAQGLFINLCSYYWQRSCNLTKDQFLRRFDNPKEFNELLKEGVFDVDKDGNIQIKFLVNQYRKATSRSVINSSNGKKGGRPKKPKKNQTKTEKKPNENQTESESKGIREDNIREEKKKKTFTEKKESFIDWFNEKKKLHTGIKGRSRILTTTDENNLKKLFDTYEFTDFEIAIKNLYKSKWAKENNMRNISHFVRIENFNKYLEQGDVPDTSLIAVFPDPVN